MLAQTCRRVGLAGFTMAVIWLLVAALNVAVLAVSSGRQEGMEAWPLPGLIVAGIGAALGLLVAWQARRRRTRPALILDIGLLFEVVTGLLIAILTQWHPMVVPMRV